MRSPPREYEGELDPRSGTERWRPVRDEERRGELSPMEKAEGWGRSRRDGNGSPTFGRKDSWRDAPDSARSRKLERLSLIHI